MFINKRKSPQLSIIFIGFLILLTTLSNYSSVYCFNRLAQDPEIILVTTIRDSGPGSFHQALLDAKPGTTIRFSVDIFPQSSPSTIEVLSPYPPLDDGFVTIDASDSGVILDGSKLPRNTGTPGLGIRSNGNVIKGLQINNFPASGIGISNGAQNNLIGGSGKGEGNVIGGNNDGILIYGSNTSNNKIIGNFIGTNASGTLLNGNLAAGIWIGDEASNNIIGGRIGIEGNLISGNDSGIIIQNSNANEVIGNLIGTDITGKNKLDPSNQGTGIGLNFNAKNNTIGGAREKRNLISGNRDGISLNGNGVVQNNIIGNDIGLDITGNNSLGNMESGIHIMDGANRNEIGPGNRIAFNEKAGIAVDGADSVENRITQNSIYANKVIAILIRDGGNSEITAPRITTVEPRSVSGQALPNHLIEVFSDFDNEGEFYEGRTTSDASGKFFYELPSGSFQGHFLTATTIDQNGNTSQLSDPAKNPASDLLKELPGILAPEQVSTEPLVIGTNIALALFSALYFGFTSSLFNEILKSYREEITNLFKCFALLFQKKNASNKRSWISERIQHQKWNFIFFWILIILQSAFVESFLDPNLELIGLERLRIVFTLFIAGLIVSGIEWLADRFAHYRFAELSNIKAKTNWAGIIFAIVSVIISRLLRFTPGYIYGIVGAIYLTPKLTEQVQSGKRAMLVHASIFLCGLCFWLFSSLIPSSLTALEPLLLTIFLVALQGTFFGILPISIFDGFDIFKWKKGLWFALFIIIFFCFYHFSLNPNGQDIQALQQNGVQILSISMAIFGFATLLLWFLFPYRLKDQKK